MQTRFEKFSKFNDKYKQLRDKEETAAVGSKWTSQEEQEVLDSIQKGTDIDDIAKAQKRTPGGIRSRLMLMAVRMIETDGKSIEDVCATLRLQPEAVLQHQRRRAAEKTNKNTNNNNQQLPRFIGAYVYLLRIEDDKDGSVVKVGHSVAFHNRTNQYPKSSVLLSLVRVRDGTAAENAILRVFKIKHKHRKDIGEQYFEAASSSSMDDIVKDFIDITAPFVSFSVSEASNPPDVEEEDAVEEI
jgi:hypothetical protein